eukprot:352861-Chlamydomonas_euryale.AAC.17
MRLHTGATAVAGTTPSRRMRACIAPRAGLRRDCCVTPVAAAPRQRPHGTTSAAAAHAPAWLTRRRGVAGGPLPSSHGGFRESLPAAGSRRGAPPPRRGLRVNALFEKFTERSIKSVMASQQEAKALGAAEVRHCPRASGRCVRGTGAKFEEPCRDSRIQIA